MATDPPTILQLIPEMDTGGAELSVVEICAALVSGEGRAIVATAGGRMLDQVRAAGGEVVILPVAAKNPARMLANAGAIARLVRDEEVALIHARSRAPAWSGWLAARRTGAVFVTTYHGAYGEKNRLKRAYNAIMTRGACVIANSDYTAALIGERYATPASKIAVIHRGVDIAEFDAAATSDARTSALRAAWDLRDGERVVFHGARLTRWKGQESVIAAAAELKRRGGPMPVVVLAGDDQGRTDYTNTLRQLIVDEGLTGHVRLVGHCHDMPAAFALADAALVASIEPEAFGRTGAEAQAAGTPVIATRLGAPQETILAEPDHPADKRTGWLYRPGDAVALADAITQALALSPDDRAALALRARHNVVSRFSTRQMQAKTLGVYDRLLGTTLATTFEAEKPVCQQI